MTLLKSEYSYHLPEDLIAIHPSDKRDYSRMMVLNRKDRTLHHESFFQFVDYLEPGSILVLNNSKVIPARLPGNRLTGAAIEVLLVEMRGEDLWNCKIKNLNRLKNGETISLCNDSIQAELVEKCDDGTCLIRFQDIPDIFSTLEQVGYAPLPPYILKMRQNQEDRQRDLQRYQTVYAKHYGSIAAPTAGFHFTADLLETIRRRQVEVVYVTLHVGLGTFEPIREDDVSKHLMHEERFEISQEAADKIHQAKKEGRKIVSVGTTTTRTLESAWNNGELKTGPQKTRLFIHPPYRYQVVDQLLTNFHLPESTLLMLVAAFADKDFILDAYHQAVAQRYRFFSYGDCMFIR